MQTISGIHYNFSLPESAWPAAARRATAAAGRVATYQDRGYFALIRNFRRHSWLLLLLFGASPGGLRLVRRRPRARASPPGTPGTLYVPHATSLRMGRLGYQSDAQASLAVSFNSLAQLRGVAQPRAHRALSGLRGDRPARRRRLPAARHDAAADRERVLRHHPAEAAIRSGERPLRALGERGVEYVEVRCVDVNPVPPGRHRRRRAALPRPLPAALPAHREPARLAGGDRGRCRATSSSWPSAAATRTCASTGPGEPVAPAEWGAAICCAAVRAHRRRARRGARRRARTARVLAAAATRAARARRRCPRRACCARPSSATASRSRASRWRSRGGTGERCSTGRSPPTPRRATRGWPRTRWPRSGASRRPTTCRSRPTASATSAQDLMSGPAFPVAVADSAGARSPP